MGYKGSGGLGAKRRKKNHDESEASLQNNNGAVVSENAKQAGISKPIEVVVRPANLGLGFGNFKEASQLRSNREIEAEIRGKPLAKAKEGPTEKLPTGGPATGSSALPSTDELMAQKAWRKGGNAASKRKPKRNIVSYQDVLEKHKQPTIIDMRGPSSSEQANAAAAPQLGEELLHNVSFLLNSYENKVHSTSHFVQASKGKLASIQSDLDSMDVRKKDTEDRMQKMKRVQQVIGHVEALIECKDLDVHKKVNDLLEGLRRELTEEDRNGLKFDQVLVPTLLSPFINTKLDSWNPLKDGEESVMSVVDSLLRLSTNSNDPEVAAEQRLSVLSRDVIPKVKAAYQSTKWNSLAKVEASVSAYEALLKAVDKFSPKRSPPNIPVDDVQVFASHCDIDAINLRDLVARQLFRGTIFPKLMRTLSQWKAELSRDQNELLDALELWLLPWIVHMDHPSIVTQISTDLKRKVRSGLSCLKRGVASDIVFLRSSMATLSPWKILLQQDVVQDLTSKYILPRLIKAVGKMHIHLDVKEQDWFLIDTMVQLHQNGLLSKREYASLVEGEVLAAWIQQLHGHFEKSVSDDSEQAAQLLAIMYTTWKQKLLPSLCDDDYVCRFFYSVLVLIQRRLDSNGDEDVASIIPRFASYRQVYARRFKEDRDRQEEELGRLETRSSLEFRKQSMSRKLGGTATFQEVVEEFASEHNVSFRPRTVGKVRTEDGKPIFLFGEVPIYIDSNVVFASAKAAGAQQQLQWKPISLEQLAVMAQQSQKPQQ